MRRIIVASALKRIPKIDITRKVCDHLLDEKHTARHRMGVGGVIILIGVAISKTPTSIHLVHFILDAIGYGVHGIGLVPFVERLLQRAKESHDADEKKDKGEV